MHLRACITCYCTLACIHLPLHPAQVAVVVRDLGAGRGRALFASSHRVKGQLLAAVPLELTFREDGAGGNGSREVRSGGVTGRSAAHRLRVTTRKSSHAVTQHVADCSPQPPPSCLPPTWWLAWLPAPPLPTRPTSPRCRRVTSCCARSFLCPQTTCTCCRATPWCAQARACV